MPRRSSGREALRIVIQKPDVGQAGAPSKKENIRRLDVAMHYSGRVHLRNHAGNGKEVL